MRGILHVDPHDAAPIWRQIEDGVRRLAASGTLQPGEAVPSVRELAKDLRVNPATVAKAYQRLNDAGILIVRRGEGTFISERREEVIENDRRTILVDSAQRFVDVAKTVNSSRKEAIEAVERVWNSDGGREL